MRNIKTARSCHRDGNKRQQEDQQCARRRNHKRDGMHHAFQGVNRVSIDLVVCVGHNSSFRNELVGFYILRTWPKAVWTSPPRATLKPSVIPEPGLRRMGQSDSPRGRGGQKPCLGVLAALPRQAGSFREAPGEAQFPGHMERMHRTRPDIKVSIKGHCPESRRTHHAESAGGWKKTAAMLSTK